MHGLFWARSCKLFLFVKEFDFTEATCTCFSGGRWGSSVYICSIYAVLHLHPPPFSNALPYDDLSKPESYHRNPSKIIYLSKLLRNFVRFTVFPSFQLWQPSSVLLFWVALGFLSLSSSTPSSMFALVPLSCYQNQNRQLELACWSGFFWSFALGGMFQVVFGEQSWSETELRFCVFSYLPSALEKAAFCQNLTWYLLFSDLRYL